MRGLLQNAFRVQEREKALLIRRLTANRQAQERLAKKPYEDLRELVELLGDRAGPDADLPLYFGAAGGPALDMVGNEEPPLDLDAVREADSRS